MMIIIIKITIMAITIIVILLMKIINQLIIILQRDVAARSNIRGSLIEHAKPGKQTLVIYVQHVIVYWFIVALFSLLFRAGRQTHNQCGTGTFPHSSNVCTSHDLTLPSARSISNARFVASTRVRGRTDTASPRIENPQTKNRRLFFSGKFPMDLRSPPLMNKKLPDSEPRRLRILGSRIDRRGTE